MPFTFAHPALFIPAQKSIKGKLSATGLILGSIIPDFEFFLKMKLGENIGHHWYGILLLDIPLSLMFTFIFHLLIKDILINVSPKWIRVRFSNYLDFNWVKYFNSNKLRVLSSIVIGILSHLFLDAFTHYDGFFVTNITFLSSNLNVLDFSIPFYSLLQIVSSIIGLAYGFLFLKKLEVKKSYKKLANKDFLLAILILTTACLFVFRLIIWQNKTSFWDLFMALMGSIIYSLIINSLGVKLYTWLLSNNYSGSNKLN